MRPGEAVEVARRALAVAPDLSEMHVALGAALLEANPGIDGPVAALRHAIELDPRNELAHVNLGMVLLGAGNLADGFREYEHREKPEPRPELRPWDGSPTNGRGILLRAEQGFGDSIHFVRYAPLVAERTGGGRIVVECPDLLRRLLQTTPGVDQVVSSLGPLPGVELQASLVSLPHLFGTTLADIPARVPYLFPPPTSNPEFARTLARDPTAPGQRRIGLVWAGNPKFGNDRRRSIPIPMLQPIVGLADARFYSLQVGAAAKRDADAMRELGIVSLAPWLTDFCETAWAITQLDLVISVDTAVAHLAGALGKPVWLMLPSNPDWRWLRDREDSVWYPTMRLFRQREIGDWPDVIARVADAIRDFTPSSSGERVGVRETGQDPAR